MYYNAARDLRIVVHVDDFLISGSQENVQWVWRELRKKYELKGEIMGQGCENEGVHLGRRIRWTQTGIEWEADSKHVQTLLSEWHLEDCNPVITPFAAEQEESDNAKVPMSTIDATAYRRAVARINDLSQDRFDLATVANKLSRSMSNPHKGDEERVKRVIRYLKGSPSCVYVFNWQSQPSSLKVMTDSDRANCVTTRRSVSGGLVLHGQHLLAHWSKMQLSIALSSGEAELNSQVKGISEGICLRNISRDWGMSLGLSSFCDSSAARGILNRTGVGKIKHLDVKQLWVQQHTNSGEVVVHRVPRADNASDLLTHAYTAHELRKFMACVSNTIRPIAA